MNVSLKSSGLWLIAGTLCFTACKKTEKVYYTVPSTYNFENVNYSEATIRVNMWSGLTGYLGKGTSRQLSQDTANYLWNNTNQAFTTELIANLPNTKDDLNASAFNLAAKTADAVLYKKLIDSAVKLSLSNTAAALEGTPGKVGSRLVNYAGLEFNQAVAKGLMGALQMNAAIEHLNKVVSDDNNTVVTGSGTAMQHDWDMAFGYISLPKNYDSSISYTTAVLDRPLAIGGYFRERGRYIKAGGKIFEAFLKGRAAIAAKDYGTRDQAIATIKEYLEKILAAACYEYANVGISGSDLAAKFHGLSEGYGFVLALKHRQPGSALSAANYQKLVDIFNTSFYTLVADPSKTKLNEAKAILTAAYGQLQP